MISRRRICWSYRKRYVTLQQLTFKPSKTHAYVWSVIWWEGLSGETQGSREREATSALNADLTACMVHYY